MILQIAHLFEITKSQCGHLWQVGGITHVRKVLCLYSPLMPAIRMQNKALLGGNACSKHDSLVACSVHMVLPSKNQDGL